MDNHFSSAAFSSTAIPRVKVMVAFERPPAEALAHGNRREKLQILEENARRHRAGLIQWIEEQGFSGEVAAIGAANSMNLLYVECTPQVAEMLKHAPGVLYIAPAD